jgi:hypothetical protein
MGCADQSTVLDVDSHMYGVVQIAAQTQA